MVRGRKDLKNISELLTKALKKIEVGANVNKSNALEKVKEYSIFIIWPDVVGERIKEHTKPVFFKQGRLLVEVDSSPWVNELKFMKNDIRKKLNEKLQSRKIKEILFKIK